MSGRDGDDKISGSTGDTLNGDVGNDTLTAYAANMSLHGGADNDTLRGNLNNDLLDGGSGTDMLDASAFSGGVIVNLVAGTFSKQGFGADTLVSIEDVTGTTGDDTITGDNHANMLNGFGGKDVIHAGGGNDVIIVGDTGFALLDGGEANDTLEFPSDSSSYYPPTITVDLAAGMLTDADGQHQIVSIENVLALPSNPLDVYQPLILTLLGTEADNVLQGDGASTLMNGRGGNDSFNNGNVSFAGAPVGVTVDLTKVGPQDTGDGTDAFSRIFDLTGSDHDDTLIGRAPPPICAVASAMIISATESPITATRRARSAQTSSPVPFRMDLAEPTRYPTSPA